MTRRQRYLLAFCAALSLSLGRSAHTADYKTPSEAVREGQRLYGLGKVDSSISEYTEAIRLDPKCVDAYLGRSLSYFAKRLR